MPLQHHPLVAELPEYADQLHLLKLSNAHFRKLLNEYEGLDKTIYRAEAEVEIINDECLEVLKKERLQLKDMIFAMLKK
ncbi:MAG: YdcH family protein [bacterium]